MLVEKGVDPVTKEIDYRLVLSAKKLNEAIAKINHSPPKIPHVLEKLRGKTYFSGIDFTNLK